MCCFQGASLQKSGGRKETQINCEGPYFIQKREWELGLQDAFIVRSESCILSSDLMGKTSFNKELKTTT